MRGYSLLFLALMSFGLTGCLSHWFLDSSSRLQVENGTKNLTLYGIDVLSTDSLTYEKWIQETILPGERSHVVEEDWVGDFRIRVRYGHEGGDTLKKVEILRFEGGSLYMKVTAEDDSLVFTFK